MPNPLLSQVYSEKQGVTATGIDQDNDI